MHLRDFVYAAALLFASFSSVAISQTPPAYQWVLATSPPAKSVASSFYPTHFICRVSVVGNPGYSAQIGYWDGSKCAGMFGNFPSGTTTAVSITGVGTQFLTLVSGTPQWLGGVNNSYSTVIPLPPNGVPGGPPDFIKGICDIAGGNIGFISVHQCVSATPSSQWNSFAMLEGTITGPNAAPPAAAVYRWVNASSPPANAITSPNSPNSAICRGKGSIDGGSPDMWLGTWASNGGGAMCYSDVSGNLVTISSGVQFLTAVVGNATWVTLPAVGNTINAAGNGNVPNQPICTRGGYIGYVYYSTCEINYRWAYYASAWQVLIGDITP